MNYYIIGADMLETLKNSLKLNQKYATDKLKACYTMKEEERHLKAIKCIDILLEELNKLEIYKGGQNEDN